MKGYAFDFKIIVFILLLFQYSFSFAQEESSIGFGANVGYKSPSGTAGFVMAYKYKKIINFYGGLASAKFSGLGYFVGFDIYLSHSNSWQPCVGIAYNYFSGDEFYIGKTGVNRSDYKVNHTNNFVGIMGIRKIILFDDKTAKGVMAFTPYVCYRYSFESNNEVIFTGGVYNKDREDKINNQIGNGFGIGVKIIYFINGI